MAAVVNSREGWYNPGGNPQRTLSALYVESCISDLFGHASGNGSLEDIAVGKAALVPLADTNQTYRWCMYEVNLLGEPSMPVWNPELVGMDAGAVPAGPPGALAVSANTHFASRTTLQVRLPVSGHVRLGIYDCTGREVRRVVNAPLQAGSHDFLWDGRGENGTDVPAGIYCARLETNERSCQCKLVKLGKETP